MIAAVRDLIRIGIAISSARIARTASHDIGDKHAAELGAIDHRAQQHSRSIARKWNAGAISSESSRCDSHEHHDRRNRAVTGNHARTTSQ
jgi:hypothetical protein